MYVSAGIENKNRDEAVEEILLQLEKTACGEIEEGELICAKQSLFNSYRALADSPSGIESWYLGRVLSGRELLSADEVMERLARIGTEDIAAIARKITHACTYFLRGNATEGGEEEDCEE
jgi:predicted Zn-dependent peptidase